LIDAEVTLPATNIPATIIAPQATQTFQPTTKLVSAPAETTPADRPVLITQINMLDAASGWGWAAKTIDTFELLRTADGGATWMSATPQDKSITPYGGVFLDAQTAWIPFFDPATSISSLLRTRDGGKTWITLPPVEAAQNAWYEFSNANDGIAQTAGVGAGQLYLNLFQTTNGGQSWAPILLTPPDTESGLSAGTVHLCNICGDNLYYDSTRTMITYGELANEAAGTVHLAISTDLGQHWQTLKLPIPNPKYTDGLVGPKPPRFFGPQGILPINIIKYNTDGSPGYSVLMLYSTQDGGQNWVAAPGLLENSTSQYDAVQILSPKDAFVRCGRNLCSTQDGAQTWQTLPDTLNFDSAQGGPDYVTQFSFVSPTSGWAISGEGSAISLWRTTDGGISWTKLAPRLVQ
jgi:photosystem II stability/assembly factor-like uncharacterized protein